MQKSYFCFCTFLSNKGFIEGITRLMNYEAHQVQQQRNGLVYGISRTVKWLLIINIIVFLIVAIGARFDLIDIQWFYSTFGQVNSTIFRKFKLWQFVSSMFIHGSIQHLLGNMIALWIFGTALEKEWGGRRFLIFYFVCGIGAGLLQFCVDPSSSIPGVGASGAIFGLLGACGLIMGDRDVYLLMAQVKLKYVVAVYTCIEIFMCIMGTRDGIGHWTHVSGFIIGILYIKFMDRRLHRQAAKAVQQGTNKRFDNIEFD